MTQKRYLQFKDPVDSFKTNRKYLGILQPGRYRGFDVLTPVSALTFSLNHSLTGIIQTEVDATNATPRTGIIVTPSGLVIHEDGDIIASGSYSLLEVDTNAGNPFERLDIVICEHEYIETVGGQNAQYSIIQGADGGPVLPAVTNTKTQIIVGTVRIPASASTLASAIWEPYPVPHLGNEINARLKENNYFEKSLGYKYGTITIDVLGSDAYIQVKNDGSHYQLNIATAIASNPTLGTVLFSGADPLGSISQILMDGDFPDRAEIKILFYGLTTAGKTGLLLKHLSSVLSEDSLQLVYNFTVNDTLLITDGVWATFQNMGSFWTLTGITHGNVVNNINEQILPTLNLTGAVWMWPSTTAPAGWLFTQGGTIGDASSGGTVLANVTAKNLYLFLWTNFSDSLLPVSSGRGVSALADYNAHKTITLPNWAGLTPMGYKSADTDFNAIGKKGGNKTKTLGLLDIPEHDHKESSYSLDGVTDGGIGQAQATGSGIAYLKHLDSSASSEFTGTGSGLGKPGVTQSDINLLNPFFTINFMIKL